MEREINAGYVITDRLAVGESEFVIGESQTAPARFVTWKCKLGGKDYYWGHYVKDRLSAVADLCRRALEQAELLQCLSHGMNSIQSPLTASQWRMRFCGLAAMTHGKTFSRTISG